jgi:hypothetical protein
LFLSFVSLSLSSSSGTRRAALREEGPRAALRGREALLLPLLLRSPLRREKKQESPPSIGQKSVATSRNEKREKKKLKEKKPMNPSAVANWASRLPLASKSSAAVILAGYLLQFLAPGIRKYLALVPAR